MPEPVADSSSQTVKNGSMKKLIFKRLPILSWLPHYTKEDIIADFVAGITVGMTMIPQSVAYAGLAGLQPQYGLYTAFIGSFTYVFFGSVKEVSIGPTSLMALLTFSYVVGRPVEYVILLTFLAGCIELAMGLFKLGFLVDFMSPCLTSGFTSATSIIIIISQLKGFLGISIKNNSTFPALQEVLSKVQEIKVGDTLLGVTCVVFLMGFKQLGKIKSSNLTTKKLLWLLSISKNALTVFVSSVVACLWFNYEGSVPFKLTGIVPRGLPDIGLPATHAEFNNSTSGFTDMVSSLGSGIIVVPLVAVLANVAIAKAYSSEAVVDASQEMISLGLANILGSFVKAMPSCGAFTRSSVASSSGVRSPLQGLYSGAVIILALSILAPYFFYIPKATLAAILIVAASSLIDYEIFPTLWRCSKVDFIITTMTFAIGILVSVEMSIVIGAIFNVLVLLKAWSRPGILIEKRTSEKGLEYLYIKPELGLFYPAADYLTEKVKKHHNKNPTFPIALDCYGFIKIDYSAAKSLETLAKTYNKKEVGIVFVNVNSKVLCTLMAQGEDNIVSLCQSSYEVNANTFSVRDMENPDEKPLIDSINGRKFSEDIRDIRKGSLCDLE
ncbi:sodium-independent sulfate anion transporter [Dendroctonus ponderosae]|uniref:sodium-independent sulfate anion transporter n=1 Tax=Dendroctonus ponderosae TaxID=77166 RepID=UPI002034EA21|nr:sodium-independent sulfate anion transporter [Dendroctonus ponderosae]